MQYQHYKACLDIFNLKPSQDSREFAELVSFVAQVSAGARSCSTWHTASAATAAPAHYSISSYSYSSSIQYQQQQT